MNPNEKMKLTFFIIANGKKYFETYLGALLESIDEIYKGQANICVSYGNIPSSSLEQAKKKLPYVKWIKSDFVLEESASDRPSQKLKSGWKDFVVNTNYKNIILMDADMILLKDISHFFKEDFDIGYTYFKNHLTSYGNRSYTKSGFTRLNTGIILVKNSDKSKQFLRTWENITNEMLLRKDLTLRKEWLGFDQASLAKILDEKYDHSKPFIRDGVLLRGFTCAQLNETECRQLSEETHVIHYKAGWRVILPEGNWNKATNARRKELCFEQYKIWRKFYEKWKKR